MRTRRSKGLSFASRKNKDINLPLVREVLTWVVQIAIVIAIAFIFVYFIGSRAVVIGQSMSSTLEDGDSVLVNKMSYLVTNPKANDVIVFLPNGNEKSHYYIKRVIAVPGDTIQIIDGAVYVNGEEFEEEIDASSIDDPELAADPITLGEDEYFVLGDNRNNSEDSRYANIGNIKKEYIVGKVWFVLSPLSKFGFL